jgi:nucleoid DNA-binding protein
MSTIQILAVISKLRPRVQRLRTFDLDKLADELAIQSGFDRGHARDFAYKLARNMVGHLVLGDSVKLDELGSFSVTCDKNKQTRVSYRAAPMVKRAVNGDFQGSFINGDNAGLDEEGFAQRWLDEHPEDTVVMRDGTTRSNG